MKGDGLPPGFTPVAVFNHTYAESVWYISEDGGHRFKAGHIAGA